MADILETGGYLLRCGVLTKDSQPFTVVIVCLDRSIEGYQFATSIWMVWSFSFVRWNREMVEGE